MIRTGWKPLLGVLALQLVGCAQLPVQAPGLWRPPTGDVWTLRGRVAVRVGEEGWHAAVTWVQTGDRFQIELAGPLGQGALRLRGDSTLVELERPDGVRDRAQDAGVLLERHTGWTLPVAGLRYWVRGLAAPDQPADWQRDDNGLPVSLEQDGWRIRYVRFTEQPGLGLMPQRIDLERVGVQVRLIADSWAGPAAPG